MRNRCSYLSNFGIGLYDSKRVSLGLVELLAGLDLSPYDIMAYEGSLPWWSVNSYLFYEQVTPVSEVN